MTKLRKYVKPYIVSVFLVIGLLFTQAYCELSLPDFMQNIVNNGIQNNGIESGVYQEIRQTTLDAYLMFAPDAAKKNIESSYRLVTPAQAKDEEVNKVPILKKEPIYFLKELDAKQNEQLEEDLILAQMTTLMVTQKAKEEGIQVPMLLMQQDLGMFQKEAKQQIDDLGGSTITSLASQLVKHEYKEMDLDMESLQQHYIFRSGLFMLFYSLGSAICAILVSFLSARISAGIGQNLRSDVFRKVTHFSNENFQKFNTSTLITRTTNDIQQVQMSLVMIMRTVFYAPIMGIGALIHVITSEANMTWIIALCVVLILSVVFVVFLLVMPKFKLMQKLTDRLNSVVRELLDGMMVIRAFNNEEQEAKKFDASNKDITKISLYTSRAMATMMPVMMFLMNGTTLLILWVGSKQVDSGIIQVGSIMAFMQYAMQVIMAFLMITMVSIMIPRANVSANRIYEILAEEPTIQDAKNCQNVQSKASVLFDHVSFCYPGADEDVLTDISFEAKPGQTTAIIGSTGSGKSTLVHLVNRFYDVTSGSLFVDGVNIKDIAQKELRDKIGYVPQKGILLSGTIESNLLYANPDATKQDMDNALEVSQSKEFVDSKPLGIHEEIAQGGTNVSGGQRQRLSIARALIKKPEIYIFDDSFSALDFKTDAKVREGLSRTCKETGSTVLLVAQRISSILHADQILVLEEGKLVGKGTHEELMKNCKVYQEIASSQLSKEELSNV